MTGAGAIGRERRKTAEAAPLGLAEEHAALLRIATLVAAAPPPGEVFAAVAEEVGRLHDADLSTLSRYEEDGARVVMATWTSDGSPLLPPGTRGTMAGRNVATMVFETGQPARTSNHGLDFASEPSPLLAAGLQCSVAAPIFVDGRLWGAMCLGSLREQLPEGIETRLADFTEFVATAIANTHARAELHAFAEEQAALRRVATRVATGAPPDDVFAVLCAEVGQLLDTDIATLNRYNGDGSMTIIGTWGRSGVAVPIGARFEPNPASVSAVVRETGRAARVDRDQCEIEQALGIRSAVGSPIIVDGRKWGVIAAAAVDPMHASDAESLLAGFAGLAASVIANAEAQAALSASRARIITTADETRQRIERELHDGVQQQLAALAFDVSSARSLVPSGTTELDDELERMVAALGEVGVEVRRIAQGLHPAALSEGGLRTAIRAVAERCPVATTLEVCVDRLPGPVEVAIYYAVAEALTNASKHSRAACIHVTIERDDEDGVVRARVSDDGQGGASLDAGTGLVGVKDRVEALGGRMRLSSEPARGTTIDVDLPIRMGDPVTLERNSPASPPRDAPARVRDVTAALSTLRRDLRRDVVTVVDDVTRRRRQHPGPVSLDKLAEEQAALRRVATLVAGASAPEEVMAAVAEEVGLLLDADLSTVNRYEENGDRVVLASWTSLEENVVPVGTRGTMDGRNVATMVFETQQPARKSHHGPDLGPTAAAVLAARMRCSIAVPVVVERRLWGAICLGSMHHEFPRDAETRLADFTELVATAIANAEARAELRAYADEQAALRRVAMHVADGARADEVFAVVCAEIGQLLDADVTTLNRYDDEGRFLVIVGTWASRAGVEVPKDMQIEMTPSCVSAVVWNTGRSARIDGYDVRTTTVTPELTRDVRSAIGAPILVDGRRWGVVGVSSSQRPLPAGTESRLVAFADLVATAIANAESQAALSAARARIVSTADETRRRIERNLHDGVQQQLVSLALYARYARTLVPAEARDLDAQLEGIRAALDDVLAEVRRIAQGLYPAVLSKGGLRPAIGAIVGRTPVPTTLDVRVDRLPQPLEVAAYDAVSEALKNAAKHAEASHVHVTIERDDEHRVVRVCVSDDGRGGASLEAGTGLVGVKDRVEALGGRMCLTSEPGAGTTYDIALPFA